MKRLKQSALCSILLVSLLFSLSGCDFDDSNSSDYKTLALAAAQSEANPNEEEELAPGFGIAVMKNGWLAVVDGASQALQVPLLGGQLEKTPASELLDVAIAPDGRTALVSNADDKLINFIDTSLPLMPKLVGQVELDFEPFDIAIAPNGRFALVTGRFSAEIAVLDLAKHSLIDKSTTNTHCAVAIAPDGQTVLTTDAFGGKVHVYSLSAEGDLSYHSSVAVTNAASIIYPSNVSIAPDGQTAIVAASAYGDTADEMMGFPVLKIAGPGEVSLAGIVKPAAGQRLTKAQSVVFSRDSRKAYLNCVQEDSNPLDSDIPNNVIETLDISTSGEVSVGGALATVDFNATSPTVGIDTLAIDHARNWLYVSNLEASSGQNHIQVIDLKSGNSLKTVKFNSVGGEDALPQGLSYHN